MINTHEIPYFGNAGGTCKTLEQVRRLANSAVTHIEVGSITVLHRDGNIGSSLEYIDSDGTSVNALGMPNQGAPYYRRVLPEMVAIANAAGKELVVNIAPINPGDTEVLCKLCKDAGVHRITFNAGCPNAWADGVQKKIVSFDPSALDREISTVFSVIERSGIQVNVKLSPYWFEHALRKEVASVLRPHPVSIITCNTRPNTQRFREDGKSPAISFRSGGQEINTGGMGGFHLEPFARLELTRFCLLLPNHPIISVGGISTGKEVFKRMRMGAHGVQIGTAFYFSNDSHVFSGILTEYSNFI